MIFCDFFQVAYPPQTAEYKVYQSIVVASHFGASGLSFLFNTSVHHLHSPHQSFLVFHEVYLLHNSKQLSLDTSTLHILLDVVHVYFGVPSESFGQVEKSTLQYPVAPVFPVVLAVFATMFALFTVPPTVPWVPTLVLVLAVHTFVLVSLTPAAFPDLYPSVQFECAISQPEGPHINIAVPCHKVA